MYMLRTGRDLHGTLVNNAVVDYLTNIVMRAILKHALASAEFFVEVTGRKALTGRDVHIGFIDAAHNCTLETMRVDDDNSDSDSGSDATGDADEEEDASDDEEDASDDGEEDASDDGEEDAQAHVQGGDDGDGDFTTAIRYGASETDVRKASEMKLHMYEWFAFRPADAIQAAAYKAINKMTHHL